MGVPGSYSYMGYPSNGYSVPGGGAPDGGRSAAYASWMQQGYGQQASQGYQGSGFSRPQKGKGYSKGKGKGKGFVKGGLFTAADAAAVDAGLWTPWTGGGDDPRRAIEAAQRRAKGRDSGKGGVVQAQRAAMMRFESDLLKRIQGRWVDGSDASTTYVVEENLCTVSGGEHNRDQRVFRNRLSVVNGELCWDARRFWHNLDIKSLPPPEEEVERVEWTPGEGSPQPSNPIVWIRAQPDQKESDDVGEELTAPPETSAESINKDE